MHVPSTSIAYLGEPYSFHFLAAAEYFGKEHVYISCPSFDQIIEAIKSKTAEYAIIAIDNTLAGPVKGNIARIAASGLFIYAEVYFEITLHLAACQFISVNKLETIYSHPMALKESSRFLSQYPGIRLIETGSTAGGIKMVAENNLAHAGAIGNKQAIQHYNLKIIAENIDNNRNNRTRFFILSREKERFERTTFQNAKTSLLVEFFDRSLLADIPFLSDTDILYNQPLMLDDGEWLYAEFSLNRLSGLKEITAVLTEKGRKYRELGIYEKGRITE